MAERKFYRKIYQSYQKASRKKRIFVSLLTIFLFGTALLAIAFFGLFVYYAKDLPRPEKFTERTFVESTKIYDRTGEILLYELYGEERREVVPLSDIPEHLKHAIIATEDANFYDHFGIDIRAIMRSIQINLHLKRAQVGGSTITQQLIRSTFLTQQKTAERKIREIILAIELDRRYDKDQILEWYLNQIPFGPNIYGVEAASQTYFNKRAKDVTVPEAAILAALIQAPSYLAPGGYHVDELLERKNYVLDRMAHEHYLTTEHAETLKQEVVAFVAEPATIKAPHFVLEVVDYLVTTYGEDVLKRGGLKVYTTLDWDLQLAAEQAIADGIERNKNARAHNAALVAIDPATGEIVALVGSADWFGDPYPEGCTSGKDCLFDPKVNVATYHIGRQPGSSFKPFVYATAFQKGYKDTEVVIDEETDFGVFGGKHYVPQNYDGLFRGPVTLRQSLAQSLNVPSVKVLAYLAGQEDSIETAKRMGITTLTRPPSFYGLSIVLGGGEVRLLDMVSAYGVFSQDGMRVPPSSILKIEDTSGAVLEENNKTPRRILSMDVAQLINDILSDNVARTPLFGAHSVLYVPDYDVAVKTGTTNDYRDAWTIGYSPTIAAGVWAGNSDNTATNRQPGLMLSAPIWRQFMDEALLHFDKESFVPPTYTREVTSNR